MPSWDDFPAFIKVLAEADCKSLNPHVKSILGNLWDTQGSQARRYDIREFFIVHIETVQPDMNKLNQELCEKHHYCETLPQVSKYNYQEKMDYEWSEESVNLIVERFRCDFEAFGYALTPAMTQPTTRSNRVVKAPVNYERCVNPRAGKTPAGETEAERMGVRVSKADAVKAERKKKEESERPRGIYMRLSSTAKAARCGGKSNDEGACSANGVCVGPDKCECVDGFTGPICADYDRTAFPQIDKMTVIKGSSGQNCEQACQGAGKRCDHNYLPVLNSCGELRKAFGCPKNKPFQCSKSFGPDQPLFVDDTVTIAKNGECLQNTQKHYFGCAGSYKYGLRLCPCF